MFVKVRHRKLNQTSGSLDELAPPGGARTANVLLAVGGATKSFLADGIASQSGLTAQQVGLDVTRALNAEFEVQMSCDVGDGGIAVIFSNRRFGDCLSVARNNNTQRLQCMTMSCGFRHDNVCRTSAQGRSVRLCDIHVAPDAEFPGR